MIRYQHPARPRTLEYKTNHDWWQSLPTPRRLAWWRFWRRERANAQASIQRIALAYAQTLHKPLTKD
jgi:hypothetical protein